MTNREKLSKLSSEELGNKLRGLFSTSIAEYIDWGAYFDSDSEEFPIKGKKVVIDHNASDYKKACAKEEGVELKPLLEKVYYLYSYSIYGEPYIRVMTEGYRLISVPEYYVVKNGW